MKNNQGSQFIPMLTTEAGRCLTAENWQEVGINMAAYDLTSLLMKPGLELLRTLPSLATYVGWSGDVILNATMPKINREGKYTLRSEYDGSRSQYTPHDILTLIAQLKPQLVLLPEGVNQAWQSLPATIMPFFTPAELPAQAQRSYGLYFFYDATTPFSLLVQQIHQYKDIPCYVGGELSLPLMNELASMGVQYIASDMPARDACQGMVYSQDGVVSLMDETSRQDFEVIDKQCNCPTCAQKFTRAYLHHLLEHTPLLCQRFLIQHNICFCFS